MQSYLSACIIRVLPHRIILLYRFHSNAYSKKASDLSQIISHLHHVQRLNFDAGNYLVLSFIEAASVYSLLHIRESYHRHLFGALARDLIWTPPTHRHDAFSRQSRYVVSKVLSASWYYLTQSWLLWLLWRSWFFNFSCFLRLLEKAFGDERHGYYNKLCWEDESTAAKEQTWSAL